jgi:hypothetical protein
MTIGSPPVTSTSVTSGCADRYSTSGSGPLAANLGFEAPVNCAQRKQYVQ